MILLKAAVLFFLVTLSFGEYIGGSDAKKDCDSCSYYKPNANVPKYTTQTGPHMTQQALDKHNEDYGCGKNKYLGQANVNGIQRSNSGNVTETKITAGEDAKPHEFPWQVGIALGLGNKISCGGSIISSKEILTAAHCVQYEPTRLGGQFQYEECIYAVVGEHEPSNIYSGEQWNRICNVEKHPGYIGNRYELKSPTDSRPILFTYDEHDIAVLRLCTELEFNDMVSPVCLPEPNPINGKYDQYGNQDVIASGWGNISPDTNLATKPKKLQKVDLKTVTPFFNSENHPSKIWAMGASTPAIPALGLPPFGWGDIVLGDTCKGDSGGPLVIKYPNTDIYTLIGAASYNYGCGKGPSAYTRVTDAMKDDFFDPFWLQNQIEGIPKPAPLNPGTCSNIVNLDINNRKNNKNTRSLKNNKETTYYHFEKDKKLTRFKAEKACKSEFGGQLTSINTMDEYEWIKKQIIDLDMKGQIAIGGKRIGTGRKFEWTDKSEMDMKVLNANWFKTRYYRFPTFKNKKRVNLELWYSRRAFGFANVFDHKARTKYICKLDKSDCPV